MTGSMRIDNHPILGSAVESRPILITINGEEYEVRQGDTIAAAMVSLNLRVHRHTAKGSPRGIFCNTGKCSDCIMKVNGTPNIRVCITEVEDGMVIESQEGRG